jgi:hypothetical protein
MHGNYLALEAVLADIRAQGIEEIVNLGDMASGALNLRKETFPKRMDGRVKPGHDERKSVPAA